MAIDRQEEKIYHASGPPESPLGKEEEEMQDIFERLQKIIADQFAVELDEITEDTSFEEDLGADSVDLVELVMGMEQEFKIGEVREEELATLTTVGDCVDVLAKKLDK